MLGSWSFLDYFKAEAIPMAWKLLTEVFKIPGDRLYVSYYGGDPKQPDVPVDNETKSLWMQMGIPADRILPFDMGDNFWEMGDTGPCGPCTEIHYDRIGGRFVPELVNADDPDVLEIWNLVFMQYYRDSTGALSDLPKGSVDTGMGLERLVSVLQGHTSNYDSDLFTPIFKKIQEKTGFEHPYRGRVGADDVGNHDMAYRVVADHIRTLSVAISDGCVPSNEGRGYILRRVLRRAVRFGRSFLGAPKTPWFYDCLEPVAETLRKPCPEIRVQFSNIQDIIKDEEICFGRTLDKGVALFNKEADLVSQSASASTISGRVAFDLYTRCGFPLDLVEIMAEERGMEVDLDSYEQLMEEHRKASENVNFKKGGGFIVTPAQLDTMSKRLNLSATKEVDKYNWSPSRGVGAAVTTKVVAIFDAVADKFLEELGTCTSAVGVVLEETNHYAESGGQVGDCGRLIGQDDSEFTVEDAQRFGEFIFHIGHCSHGNLKVGDIVSTDIDFATRSKTAANHTATHLINFALRRALAADCDQRGSIVDGQRLRFDFAFSRGLTEDEIANVEKSVSDIIDTASEVFCAEVPLEKAMAVKGLRAVAGGTYPDPVRMVTVGVSPQSCIESPDDGNAMLHSVEFCGGTHLHNTREMKKIVVVSEEAVAKGVRRIVCFTGTQAEKAMLDSEKLLTQIAAVQSKSTSSLDELQRDLSQLRSTMKESFDSIGLLSAKRAQKMIDQISAQVLALQKERSKALIKVGETMGSDAAIQIADGAKFIVIEDIEYSGAPSQLDGDSKAMDAVIKKVFVKNAATREAPIMIISSCGNAVAIQIQTPPNTIDAAEWGKTITTKIGGKCGGKAVMARGIVKDCQLSTDMALGDVARNYAKSVMN
eukprot:GHVH01004928.1.p1 GENE.GHVH01004928.1~~GHVH01004928.1.p1  ORF type:complete len:1001 (+),score=203.74 GHVH01004928.1:374-3004(+)